MRLAARRLLGGGAARGPVSQKIIDVETKYSAHNYSPIPVVFASAKGARVTDPEGNKYYDFLSAYSAVNQGHCHPRIIAAMRAQLDKLTLSSRAFHNDVFAPYCKFMCETFAYERILPMNTGAEACETAIKLSRKWGYMRKRIPTDEAIIIVARENFHGRTTTIVSFSTDPEAREHYGPFTPGFVHVDFGCAKSLADALRKWGKRTAAFMVEPIQGEAGVKVPPAGYLRAAQELCREHNVLMVCDEVQTGLARTGRMLAHEHDGIRPDIVVMAKALSGGLYPVSAVMADSKVMDVFAPGTHGSTFGGNPLGCAVAMEAVKVIIDEKLADRAATLGEVFRTELAPWAAANAPMVREVRGRGLLNAIELDPVADDGHAAYRLCILLRDLGLLAKPTHGNIVRFSPPLVISEAELRECVGIIKKALTQTADDIKAGKPAPSH